MTIYQQVYYEFGNSLLVYEDLIIQEEKKYYKLKQTKEDEYVLADSVEDVPHQIYFIVNNIDGVNIYLGLAEKVKKLEKSMTK